jgi:hypothetical protein
MKMSITVPVEKLLKDFKYKTEFDSHTDVFHDGYSAQSVLNMNLNMPDKYEDLEKLCPSIVGQAMEDCEREGYYRDAAKAQIQGLINSLEKINVGTAEYQDLNSKWISQPAYIDSATYDKDSTMITIDFVNPHHLINAIIGGVGMYAPDIDADEDPSQEDIISRLHHLPDYFKVWGESQDSGELDSRHTPDYDTEAFENAITCSLDMVSDSEMAEFIKDAVEEDRLTLEECVKIIKRMPEKEFSLTEVKKELLNFIEQEIKNSQDTLTEWKDKLKKIK